MTTKKAYLILQAALCTLLVIILISTAVGIYRDGLERRAQNPLEPIYTRELVLEKLKPVAPLFFLSLGFGAAGLVLGVKDEKAGKPVKPVNNPEPNRTSADSPAAEPDRAGKKKSTGKGTGLLQAVLILAAVALIAAGVLNGSARDVLYKAAKICTECVGLG